MLSYLLNNLRFELYKAESADVRKFEVFIFFFSS